MQPAPAITGAEEAAFERLQRSIAKNSTDDGPVAQPFLLCRGLEAPEGRGELRRSRQVVRKPRSAPPKSHGMPAD